MKHLLRKLFFWDAPAQGAFFHATLMWAVPWCISAFLCFWLAFLLTREPSDVLVKVFGMWLVLIPFYSMSVIAGIEAVIVVVCLVRLFVLGRRSRQDVRSREWLVLCLRVMAGLLWLSTGAVLLAHWERWTAYVVPALALALCGYACLGGWLKHIQNDLICKGVRRIWWIVAVVWTVSLCLAISAKIAANRNCADLEKLFGRPPTAEARDARITRECRIDADFWRKVREILARRPKPGTGYVDGNDDSVIYINDILEHYPDFRKLTPLELDRYRRQLADFTELSVLETMFSESPPLLLHEDYIRLEVADALRKLFMAELWRLHFALVDKEMETVMEAIRVVNNLLECWRLIETYSFGNSGLNSDRLWFFFLEKLLSSPLPTDEQLAMVKELLEKSDPAYREALYGKVYDLGIRFNEQFEMKDDFLAGEALPVIYPVFYLLHSVNGGYWEKPSWSRRVTINAGHLLLPQFFWFAANDQCIVFKVLRELPETMPAYNCGSLLVGMDFHYDWLQFAYYGYRNVLAKNRVLRCAIDALLEYRRTGAYPASMPSALEDPYTGKPLKYRVGECCFFDYDKQKAVPIQAIQVWSVGPNKTDDDGVNFDLPGDAQRTAYSRRDDIRILLPLKQSKP